jgi:hypothetical protein
MDRFNDYINDAYLNRLYDDLSKEQASILLKLRNRKQGEGEETERLYQKEVSVLTALLSSIVKLRDTKQKIQLKEI